MPEGSRVIAAKKTAKKTSTPARATSSRATSSRAGKAVRSAKKNLPAAKKAGKAVPAKKSPAKKTPAKKTPAKKSPAKKSPAKKAPGPVKARKAGPRTGRDEGLDRFLQEQRKALEAERASYEAQATALKEEADQMALDAEPGDIQFDDESGEGGTVNVDRERDLALSAQARAEVEEIDYALAKIDSGSYGACESCGQPIPRARLKALPQARLCVSCKSGGLSRR